MRFAKYQALGNDYLLVLEEELSSPLSPAQVRRLCHRNLGVGADGVLLGAPRDGAGRFPLRIFNPDGSEAEKSGNGLRIFARALWDRGLVSNEAFEVATAGGQVRCEVAPDGRRVRAEMGRVRFESTEIPVAGPAREVLGEPIVVAGRALEFSAASVGNPHCVIQLEDPSEADARELGPLLECDPRFPRRTNVQLVRVVDRGNLRIEIWERGAGYTLSSGTSSCAAAGVSRRLGLCDSKVKVHMPGGVLAVEIDDHWQASIDGPVRRIAEGEVAPETFEVASP